MKLAQRLKIFAFGLSAIASTMVVSSPKAVSFEEQLVNQGQFLVVAVPFGYKEHRLEIIEQIPGGQQCWQESSSNPVVVNLLLLNFDHSKSCQRITNTNGYSLRLNGQDERVSYIIKIVERNGELNLVATHKDPQQPELLIGRTYGLSNAPLKIILNPGWRLTKRVHQGETVQHVYLSGGSSIAQIPNPLNIANSNISFSNPAPVNTNTSSFSNLPQQVNTVPTNPVPTTTAPPTSTVVGGNTLIDSVSQVYNSLVSPFLSPLIGGLQGNQTYQSYCQGSQPGSAIWSESQGTPQRVPILADGTLQLSNTQQINIKPILANNGINPDQFLASTNGVNLDFDGDGAAEGLQIEQPPQACPSANY
jgi:hypothetical protein